MVAARKGRVGVVRKLIQHGASVNIKNKVNSALFLNCTQVIISSTLQDDKCTTTGSAMS